MARGWESKAVQDLVEELSHSPVTETAEAAAVSVVDSAEDPERRHRLESLRLVRSQVSEQLNNARTVTQRQVLHQRLRAIDSDIESIG